MDVTKGEFVGAVTAVHFSADGSLLYAAVGCTLYVYDVAKGTMFVSPLSVWSQGTIHGMDVGRTHTSSLALCFGQKQLGLVTSLPDTSALPPSSTPPSVVATECMDWILDARLLLDDVDTSSSSLPKVAVGLAHNMVHIWDPSTQTTLERFQCTERTILYAMGLYGRSLDTLIVAAGTVFQHILVWSPPPHSQDPSKNVAQVAQRLHQHDGVLFQLTWSATGRQLASVSDDRSVQLWSNLHDGACDDVALPRASNLQHSFQSQFRGWGHTARVWDVQFTKDRRVVSASEDATVKVWSVAGECLATLSGHVDTNVWRVAVHPSKPNWVATGGGDNAIKLWDVDAHIANQSLAHVTSLPTLVLAPTADQGADTAVTAAKKPKKAHHAMAVRSLVTLASSVVWISDQGHVGITPLTTTASPPLVVQLQSNVCCVAATSDLVVVGDVAGHLRLLSSASLAAIATVPGHTGRVMSIWIVQEHNVDDGMTLFTTGVDLTLREWHFDGSSALTLTATYQCPSKNGCISALASPTKDGGDRSVLWCGDARGNVCVYERTGGGGGATDLPPVQPKHVLWQVHGKDVVSGLAWRNDKLYSCGHDGFICTLRCESSNQLRVVRRVGVKGISTLKAMHWNDHGDLVVFGFHATHAIVVNVTQSVRVLAVECGGYRRPHALCLDPTAETSHVFAFTTPGTTALQVHTFVRPSSRSDDSPPPSWHGHHHSKMGTCVTWVDPASDTPWIVTGGEDCALKLHRVNRPPSSLTKRGKQVECADSVTMHGTNVRSLAVVGRDWVVSGGGKQSVHLWRVVDGHLDHVAEHTPSNVSQDQRILALAATPLDRSDDGDVAMTSHDNVTSLAVFVTNSEGQTAFFTADATSGLSFHRMWHGPTDKPILSCALTPSGFFVTGATDGHVVVWDVAPLLTQPHGDDEAASSPRLVYQYRAHDMGVNCLCIRPTGAAAFDIVSGGDDQCISVAAVDAADRWNVSVLHRPGKRNASASALKAIQALGDVIVAAGYDQRVTAWSVNDEHEWTWRGAAYSECADIAGVSLRQRDDGAIEAVVVGKGMQTIEFR